MGEPSLGLGPVPRRCGVALSTPQRRQNLLKCAQEEEKRAAAYNFEATPKIKASIERKLHELRKCEGHRADNKKNLDLRLALVADVDELDLVDPLADDPDRTLGRLSRLPAGDCPTA